MFLNQKMALKPQFCSAWFHPEVTGDMLDRNIHIYIDAKRILITEAFWIETQHVLRASGIYGSDFWDAHPSSYGPTNSCK